MPYLLLRRRRLGLHQLSDMGYHHTDSVAAETPCSSSLLGAAGGLGAGRQLGRGNPCLGEFLSPEAWDPTAHLQSFHCSAAALLHSNRYRTGDLSHSIPFTVKAVLIPSDKVWGRHCLLQH